VERCVACEAEKGSPPVERCLACEAVVNRAITLGRTFRCLRSMSNPFRTGDRCQISLRLDLGSI
jgi:hypothetical protein